jgi:hypothetical protein
MCGKLFKFLTCYVIVQILIRENALEHQAQCNLSRYSMKVNTCTHSSFIKEINETLRMLNSSPRPCQFFTNSRYEQQELFTDWQNTDRSYNSVTGSISYSDFAPFLNPDSKKTYGEPSDVGGIRGSPPFVTLQLTRDDGPGLRGESIQRLQCDTTSTVLRYPVNKLRRHHVAILSGEHVSSAGATRDRGIWVI